MHSLHGAAGTACTNAMGARCQASQAGAATPVQRINGRTDPIDGRIARQARSGSRWGRKRATPRGLSEPTPHRGTTGQTARLDCHTLCARRAVQATPPTKVCLSAPSPPLHLHRNDVHTTTDRNPGSATHVRRSSLSGLRQPAPPEGRDRAMATRQLADRSPASPIGTQNRGRMRDALLPAGVRRCICHGPEPGRHRPRGRHDWLERKLQESRAEQPSYTPIEASQLGRTKLRPSRHSLQYFGLPAAA